MNRSSITRLLGLVIFILIIWAIYALAKDHTTPPVQTPTSTSTTTTAMFYCSDTATIQAVFTDATVALTLSDGRTFTLPHAVSADGARYEATSTSGSDVVFWNKGNNAFITENGKTTYADCTAAKVAASDAPGYNTYTDQSGLFTFAYPTNFQVSGVTSGYSQAWAVQATTSGMLLAHIVVPKSYDPGTNFGDASFTVGVSSDPSAVATCLLAPNGPNASSSEVTINGASFTKLTSTDAAAGNRYQTTSYRTVSNNQCYAIEYTIHYGVLENYPKGEVKAYDEAKIQSALDEVAQSFQFLPQS